MRIPAAALLVALIGALGIWLVTGSSPVVLDQPEFAGFNYTGGAAGRELEVVTRAS